MPTRAQLEANIARMPRAEREKLWREMKPLYDERCRRDAERSLLAFVKLMWPIVEPATPFLDSWVLNALCEHMEAVTSGEIQNLLINVPPGFAKALDCDTQVLTTWGWKRHGDLQPGDFVFGPDGQPKRVLARTANVMEACRTVRFDDGAEIIAGQGHLWRVERDYAYGAPGGRRCRKTEVVTTTALLPSTAGRALQRPDRIAVTEPIQTPPRRLLIDPYVLGAWLGDGATLSGCMYSGGQDVEHFAGLGRVANTRAATGRNKQTFHRIAIEGLQTKLRVLGLLGNKHIPDDYLEASVDQRWELLRGLMDTDGTATKAGHCSYVTKLEHLSEQIQTLACSLGLKAHRAVQWSTLNGERHGPYHQVVFTAPAGARIFGLERKQARLKGAMNARSRGRYVASLEAAGERLVNCITVEGEIYLAGRGFVATHNSLITNVFWPAWEWGPKHRPHERYLTFSYSAGLTVRDNRRFREIVQSPEYRLHWGDVFSLDSDNIELVQNNKTGFKLASSVGGRGTGERGSRLIYDDLNSVKEAESPTIREETNRWVKEVAPSRLNDQSRDPVVCIQQRTHEEDASGAILSSGMPFEHLMIPMEWDGRRYHTSIGWTDPRDDDGELAWPERFPHSVVVKLRTALGPYAYAGQYQQAPSPRGGGIILDEWWQPWDREDRDGRVPWPACEYIIGSLDTAYTEKTENDYSAMTVWGVWRDEGVKLNYHGTLVDGFPQPKLMLMGAWRDRLALHPKLPFEESEWAASGNKGAWERSGLVERVGATCRRMKVDTLLIENKAAGISVSQEIARLYRDASWQTVLFDPSRMGDKVNRLHAVVPIFSQGLVYAPPRDWAQMVQDEVRAFPRGAHDDLVDSSVQAIRWLRDKGIIQRYDERGGEVEEAMQRIRPARPLYPV